MTPILRRPFPCGWLVIREKTQGFFGDVLHPMTLQESPDFFFENFLHLKPLQENRRVDPVNMLEHSAVFALHPGENHYPDELDESGHQYRD